MPVTSRVPTGKIAGVSDRGTIFVVRPAGGYRDVLRAYQVHVDGAPAAKVKPGERVGVAVTAGQHDVRAVIDGFGSPTLRVAVPAGGDVELTVQSGGSPATAAWQMRRRDTYLRLTTSDQSATVVTAPPSLPGRAGWVALSLLVVVAVAGIYLFFRGVGDFLHGGSRSAGAGFLVLGLACYVGALLASRLLRRRGSRHHPQA